MGYISLSYAAILISCSLSPALHAAAWEAAPSLNGSSTDGITAALFQGNIIATGAAPSSGSPATSVVQYLLPGASSWTLAPNLPDQRYAAIVASTPHKLIVTGGILVNGPSSITYYNTGYEYSPDTGGGNAISNKQFVGSSQAFCTDSQGRIYTFGGTAAGNRFATVERYDSNTNSWSTLAALSEPVFAAAAVYDGMGNILLFGGIRNSLSSNQVLRYSIANNSWSLAGTIPVPISRCAVAKGADGRIYLAGGNSNATPGSTTRIYEISTGQWTTGPNLSVPRSGGSLVLADDNYIYYVGGSATTSVERLNTAPNAVAGWTNYE